MPKIEFFCQCFILVTVQATWVIFKSFKAKQQQCLSVLFQINEVQNDSTLFEGDIDVPYYLHSIEIDINGSQKLNAGFCWSYAHWPSGIVPYIIDDFHFDESEDFTSKR